MKTFRWGNKLSALMLILTMLLTAAPVTGFATETDGTPGFELNFDEADAAVPDALKVNSSGWTTELVDDGRGGKALQYSGGENTPSAEIVMQYQFGPVKTEESQTYEYGYKFKLMRGSTYGDFMQLLNSQNKKIVDSAVYNGELRIAGKPLISKAVDIENFIEVKVLLYPQTKEYVVTADYAIAGEPVHSEVQAVSAYDFGTLQSFKFKTGLRSLDLVLDDIYLREQPGVSGKATVTFDSKGGSTVAPQQAEKGGKLTALPKDPVKEGFEFGGWFIDDGTFEIPFTVDVAVEDDLTVYAKWVEKTVGFLLDFDGTDAVIPEGLQTGEAGWITSLVDDGRGGRALQYSGKSATAGMKVVYDFGAIPADGKKYEFGYQFKMSAPGFYGDFMQLLGNGTSTVVGTKFFTSNIKLDNPDEWLTTKAAEADGYVGVKTILDPGSQSYTIMADYTVQGIPVHEEKTGSSKSYTAFQYVKIKSNNAANVNLLLDNIYLKEYVPNEYTVTFYCNGGSAVAPIKTITGKIELPPVPVREGYSFGGWFKDQALTQGFDGTGIVRDMNVYAKWIKNSVSDYFFNLDFENEAQIPEVFLKPQGNLISAGLTDHIVDQTVTGKAMQYIKGQGEGDLGFTYRFDAPVPTEGRRLEYGFQYLPENNTMALKSFMQLTGTGGIPFSIQSVGGKFLVGNQELFSLSEVRDWVEVKAVLDFTANTYRVSANYTTGNGIPASRMAEGKWTAELTELTCLETRADKTDAASGFAIDNLYLCVAPAEPLTVTETTPANGAVGVGNDTSVTISFSKGVRAESLEAQQVLFQNSAGEDIPKTVKWSDSRTLAIIPDGALEQKTRYTVTLPKTLTAEDGATMTNAYTLTFMTTAPYDDGGIFDGKDTLKIAWLGGSITAGTKASTVEARFSTKVTDYLRKQYPDKIVTELNRGVGGTGSLAGCYRLSRDIISQAPDVVFVEFAVNDKFTGDQTSANVKYQDVVKQMEGIVRRLQKMEKPPVILFVYTTTSNLSAVDGSIAASQEVAKHYGIPVFNLRDYAAELLEKNEITAAEHDFWDDGTHPTDKGYQYYADFIVNKLRYETREYLRYSDVAEEKLNPDCYEFDVDYEDPTYAEADAGWKIEYHNGAPYAVSNTADSVLTYQFSGPMLAMENWIQRDCGKVEIRLDGELVNDGSRVVNGIFDTYYNSGGQGVYWVNLLNLENKKHTLQLRVTGEKNASSTGTKIRINNFISSTQDTDEMELLRISPCDGTVEVALDIAPVLTFTCVPADSALNAQNIILTADDGEKIACNYEKDPVKPRMVRVIPQKSLKRNTGYTLTVRAGLQSEIGNKPLKETCTLSFTTGNQDPSVLVDDSFDDLTSVADSNWSPNWNNNSKYTATLEEHDGGKAVMLTHTASRNEETGAVTVRRPFAGKGDGIYEISFQFNPAIHEQYIKCLMTPIGTVTDSGGVTAENKEIGYFAVYNGTLMIQCYPDGAAGSPTNVELVKDIKTFSGWADIKYVIDTNHDTWSAFVSYTDQEGKKHEVREENKPLQYDVSNITGLQYVANAMSGFGASGQTTAKTSQYLFDNILVRMEDAPYVTGVTPADGSIDVSRTPLIQISFSEAMQEETLTKDAVKLLENDRELSADSYMLEYAKDSFGCTLLTVKITSPLEYKTAYQLKIADTAVGQQYRMAKPFEMRFTTEPKVFDVVSIVMKDENNKEVISLADAAGQSVNVRVTIRNFGGKDVQEYAASVALVDDAGGMIGFERTEGQIALNETKMVLDQKLKVPETVNENYRVHLFVWNSMEGMQPLISKQVLPQK